MSHVPTQVKRRLYGTILLLGGVANTAGLATYLEWRISALWKLAPDSTEVVVVVPPVVVVYDLQGIYYYLVYSLLQGIQGVYYYLVYSLLQGIERVEVATLPDGVSPEDLIWRGGAASVLLDGCRS